MHKIFTLLLSFVFSGFIFAQNITEFTLPPAPIYKCGDAPAKLNQILYGATPPNSQNKPVVVFIHGWFDNGYAWFMAKNQWYQNLYNQNIRTAFLFQHYSGSFQDNGKVVADMIRKICAKYNTNNVVAVCHSKGGFDIEWAMYNYGIEDSVSHVITLNTPYLGAPMVDLISNPIVRLITENIPIVGPIFKGAGTYQMSPAYMKGVVRPMLDNHPKNEPQKFRCHGSWGYLHPTVLPNPIPDDILKVVFYDYQPLCLDIPGLSQIGSGLMSFAMGATGLVTSLIPVQDAYQNPAKNTYANDGLAPYYSSIRPGAIEISERPNASSTNLNHIDVLLSKYTWNVVNNELQDIMNGNGNRVAKKDDFYTTEKEQNISSSMQMIDADNFDLEVKNNESVSVMLLGNYENTELSIFDENNNKIYSEIINHQAKTFWETFKIINTKSLSTGKYTIKTNKKIKAILIDESDARLELKIDNNKIYVNTINWNTTHDAIDVQATLNRNIDEDGKVIWDKIIPISLKYNASTDRFESDELLGFETGNYNISVYAKSQSTQRFATTSHYYKKTNASNSILKIYPNIANDDFYVLWENIGNANLIQIFDIQGKLIYSNNILENTYKINLNTDELNLKSGLYVIKVGNESAKLMIAK